MMRRNPHTLPDPLTATDAEMAEARIRRRVHELAEFYRHLTLYVMVISGLWLIAWLTGAIDWDGSIWSMWPIFPTLGWGIGLLCHAMGVFSGIFSFSGEWQDRKVKEYLARENARQKKIGL
jgi:hypothetical protein